MKVRCSHLVLAIAAGLCLSPGAFSAPVASGSPNAAPQGAKARLSSAQLAEMQARISLGNQIVQNRQRRRSGQRRQ